MYTTAMRILKATEARAQWKEVLDRATRGETIYIERTGVTYTLSRMEGRHYEPGVWNEPGGRVVVPDYTTPPHGGTLVVEKKSVANAMVGVFEDDVPLDEMPNLGLDISSPIEDPEQPCCKKNVPCRHWEWNGVDSVWVNALSGRIRSE